jgi:hypothetical protein
MSYVKNKKVIALNIKHYLRPLALAISFMYVRSMLGFGAKIATIFFFTIDELNFLC